MNRCEGYGNRGFSTERVFVSGMPFLRFFATLLPKTSMTDIAFVLCAGFGERLRPMTLSTPKPLMPIWNRPLLAHTLDALAGWGVREVFLNTHWLAEHLRDFMATYKGPLMLRELHEREILGTGGGLRALEPHLGGRPFWLVNGDVAFDLDPAPIAEAFDASGRFAAAWLEPRRGPRTVETDYMRRITCWASPTPGVEHTATFAGVSLLSPDVVGFLPKDKAKCSVVEAFERAMAAGKFVRGVTVKGAYWNDVGTPKAYLQVHRDAHRLPALARYAAHAGEVPAPEVRRALALLGWKAKETIVIPLGARGSKRVFWRLVGHRRAAIAIAYETEGRAENARYAACAKALAKAGVPVPKVFADQPGLLLMEDLGDLTLDNVAALKHEDACGAQGCAHASDGSPNALQTRDATTLPPHPTLRAVMELLAAFHRADVGDLPLEPPFDAKLYAWEVELYERFVAPLPPQAKAEWTHVRDALLSEPYVLVHRDFQSTNLLWRLGRPFVIDFQGMRRGPALYDLASVFYDPYMDWSEAAVNEALAIYAKISGRDLANLRAKLPHAGVQRLLQAIGAYHRLASVGQPRFLRFVPVARIRAATLAQAAGFPALAKALRAEAPHAAMEE